MDINLRVVKLSSSRTYSHPGGALPWRSNELRHEAGKHLRPYALAQAGYRATKDEGLCNLR